MTAAAVETQRVNSFFGISHFELIEQCEPGDGQTFEGPTLVTGVKPEKT
jgi:hypothetical protein